MRPEEVLELLSRFRDEYDRKITQVLDQLTDNDLCALVGVCSDEIHEFSRFRLEIKHRAETTIMLREGSREHSLTDFREEVSGQRWVDLFCDDGPTPVPIPVIDGESKVSLDHAVISKESKK